MGKKLEQSAHQRDEYERIIVNQMESGTIGEITRPAHRKQSVLYASQGSGQGNSGHHKGQNVVWCQCQTTLPSKQRQWLHAQRTLLTFTPVEYTTASKDVTKPANWRYWEGIGIRVEDRCLSFPVHVGRREEDFQFTRVPFTAESSPFIQGTRSMDSENKKEWKAARLHRQARDSISPSRHGGEGCMGGFQGKWRPFTRLWEPRPWPLSSWRLSSLTSRSISTTCH